MSGPRRPLSPEQTHWRELVRSRPPEIDVPGPGQESVWDYPRPPVVQSVTRTLRVWFADTLLVDAARALRVIETSSPPVYYVPPEDVAHEYLCASRTTTVCEWKGHADYASIAVGDRLSLDAAWSYPDPEPEFAAIRDHWAFFAGRVDACYVGDTRVTPQPGDYYGGWITPEIVGPFKGAPGSERW